MGNNLQEIAGFAFCDCFSLNTSLPQTLEKIGEYAFKQCTSFTGIDLSLSVLRSIGNQAFLNCTALSSITLPASLQSIGKECFAGCSSLTGITLPQKLESMGEGCFSHCISLTEVDIKERDSLDIEMAHKVAMTLAALCGAKSFETTKG